MQITYQKRDGNIIQKFRNTMLPYKIGDTTSMGWKVLNIEYEYKDKYYTEYEYNKLIYKNSLKSSKKRASKETYKEELKKIMYYIIAVLIINLIKKILGI